MLAIIIYPRGIRRLQKISGKGSSLTQSLNIYNMPRELCNTVKCQAMQRTLGQVFWGIAWEKRVM